MTSTELIAQMTSQELAEYQAAIDEARAQDGSKAFDLRLMKVALDGADADQFKATDGAKHPVISGIVVVARKARSYYAKAYERGSHERPDCFAVGHMEQGSVAPNGVFGGTCTVCPMNEWESSATGKGKACREVRALGIMAYDLGPVLLRIPPTSIQAWNTICSSLRGQDKDYFRVRMRIVVAQGKVLFAVDENAPKLTWAEGMEIMKSRAEWIALIERDAGVDEAAGYEAEADSDDGGYYGT